MIGLRECVHRKKDRERCCHVIISVLGVYKKGLGVLYMMDLVRGKKKMNTEFAPLAELVKKVLDH